MDMQEKCKALEESGVGGLLPSWNIVVVDTPDGRWFCHVLDGMLYGYFGLEGFATYVGALRTGRDDMDFLESFNQFINQEMTALDLKSGDAMEKRAMHAPVPVKDTEKLGRLLDTLLDAKDAFASYKESHEKDGWNSVLTDGVLTPFDADGLELPASWMIARADEGKVLSDIREKGFGSYQMKVSIFVAPVHLGQDYPVAQILFDSTHNTPLDGFLVEDFESGYADLVSHFLQICSEHGIPESMVCHDERSYYLYQQICGQLGIKQAMHLGGDPVMRAVDIGFVQSLHEMMHGHEEGEGHHCCHHHDHGEECHCHDHEEGEEHHCHHHDHGEECHCHDHEEGEEHHCHHHDHGEECHCHHGE